MVILKPLEKNNENYNRHFITYFSKSDFPKNSTGQAKELKDGKSK